MDDIQRAELAEKLLIYMSRHLVALTGAYESLDENGKSHHFGTFALSGFILSFDDQWYWTTAGHCLSDNLDKNIQAGKLQISQTRFMDYFGPDAKNLDSIPFPYEVGCGFYVENSELGIDFGMIPVPHLTRLAFEKNGVVPVSRKNWLRVPDLTFDAYYMLGLPCHLAEENRTGERIEASVEPVMVAIERIPVDKIEGASSNEWFAGRIHPKADIESVEGMSGGPIFGFRRDAAGVLGYHVVAVQSRWREKSRIVFGCSLPDVAETLNRCMALTAKILE